MASGCVRIRRSLLPFRSWPSSPKRSPRKSASESRRFWISVPMAPSSTRMRLWAISRIAFATSAPWTVVISDAAIIILSVSFQDAQRGAEPRTTRPRNTWRRHGQGSCVPGSRLCPAPESKLCRRLFRLLSRRLLAQPQDPADGVDEVGAVHGVEVEVADTAVDEVDDLLRGDCRCDELAGLDVLVEALEARGEPVRQRGTGATGEVCRLLEVLHGQDAGNDRDVDAACPGLV